MTTKMLSGAVTFLAMIAAPHASGSVLAQWDYNTSPNVPSTGTGTAVVFSTIGTWFSAPSGSPGDPALPAADRGLGLGGLPVAGAASATEGIGYTTNGSGATEVTATFHMLIGSRASRYYQLQGTTNGTTWTNLTGGTPIQPTTVAAGASSASVSANGLVDIRMNDGVDPVAASTEQFSFDFGYILPSSYDNKSVVGFRIMSAWDAGVGDYVSSFAGTTAADTAKGYSTSGASAGDVRLDYVTITGIPEPTAMAALGALGAISLRRRRQS